MKSIKTIFLIFILIGMFCCLAAETAISAEQSDLEVLVGEWVRTDGGYTLHVRDVKQDGTVDAGYLNPRDIHIAESNASVWKGLAKLFIKLQDKGYPGSTYNLYYYAEKDALVGFYFQAVEKQTFEVIFQRR